MEYKLHDKDIREPLFDFLDRTYGKNRIIEEKQIGKSRADVVMVLQNVICGIEIKSDADTYTRLASQVKDYDKFYDLNFLVIGTSHAAHAHEHVPEYWGIITVEKIDDTLDFYMFRKPSPNPKVKWKNKLSILWRPELAKLQELNQMPKYRTESKDFVQKKILERLEAGKINEDTLKAQISEILFERDYTTIKETLEEFKKSERARRIEKERDPEQMIKLIEQRMRAKENFKNSHRRRRKKRA